eukprot:10297806-Alexandrium_andersonii.AAC.1
MRLRGGGSATADPGLDALDPIRRDSAPEPHTPVRGGVTPSPPGGSAASRSRTCLGIEEDLLFSSPGGVRVPLGAMVGFMSEADAARRRALATERQQADAALEHR